MRISDWSSDVCSSDLCGEPASQGREAREGDGTKGGRPEARVAEQSSAGRDRNRDAHSANAGGACACLRAARAHVTPPYFSFPRWLFAAKLFIAGMIAFRSEEHTSELQSLMLISYAVFCLKKKKT